MKKYPHDTQARIFLAESLGDGYDDAGEPKAGQKEKIAILEEVLKEAPNDSAANHYWIHAIEPGNHPERAIKSAELLASLAPTSGHMVHMPGHIYYRVGDYAEAEHWFTASMEADERYMREQHVGLDNDWNYVHNLMYGIANLMEQGRLEHANALSDHAAGSARQAVGVAVHLVGARPDDAAEQPASGRAAAGRLGRGSHDGRAGEAGGRKDRESARPGRGTRGLRAGMKAVENGMRPRRERRRMRMDAGLWRLQQRAADEKAAREASKTKKDDKKDEPPMEELMPDALPDPILKSLSIASEELRAGVLVATGQMDEAKKVYADAQLEEKNLGYHEPPMYIRPVGETEAAVLMRTKDYAGAKAAYEEALKERPNSGFGLYGLAQVKEAQGDAAGARDAYAAFLKAWANADATLPQVAHAKLVVSGESLAEK